MKIKRAIFETLEKRIKEAKKGILIYGARQVGKTTLVNDVLKKSFKHKKILKITGDEIKYHEILSSQDQKKLASLVSGYDIFFLDEAQKIKNIGINLKILIDQFPKLQIIVTGSSSFELKNELQEPLTGRIWTYKLFPINTQELAKKQTDFELKDAFETRLIYGNYPDIFTLENYQDKKEYLQNLSQAYLYKDIFEITRLRYPEKIRKLLQLLAFQVTNEISLSELSRSLEMTKETVAHYLDLLEKSFIIFRLSGFHKNLRKEITRMDKIFFWDNGIRNTVIDNFKSLENRNDIGALWENFVVSERMKKNIYDRSGGQSFFWRLHSGSEIDYIEELNGGELSGYEIKYNARKKVKIPKSWQENYPKASFEVINQENILDFIL